MDSNNVNMLQRQTPRLVLLLVAGGAVLQLIMDHFFLPLVLPASLLLTRTLSAISFCFCILLLSAVLGVIVMQQENKAYRAHQLTRRTRDDKGQKQHTDDWDSHSNMYGSLYAIPSDCRHLRTDNLL